MVSGNFLVGSDLQIAEFLEYIKPGLDKEGYKVTDMMAVYKNNDPTILVAITGGDDIEGKLNAALVDVGYKEKRIQHHVASYTAVKDGKERYDEGRYEILGLYQDNETAHQMFPTLVQDYLITRLEKKVGDLEKKIGEVFSKPLSEIGKK